MEIDGGVKKKKSKRRLTICKEAGREGRGAGPVRLNLRPKLLIWGQTASKSKRLFFRDGVGSGSGSGGGGGVKPGALQRETLQRDSDA